MEHQQFETSDSNFVAYLRAKKINPLEVKKNGSRVAFYFDNHSDIYKLWQQWQLNPTGDMAVIKQFVDNKIHVLKIVKSEMEDSYGRFYK